MKNIKTYEKFNIEKFKEKSNKFFNSPYEDDSIALKLIEYVSTHDIEIDRYYTWKLSFSVRLDKINSEDPFGEDANENLTVEIRLSDSHILGNTYSLYLNGDEIDVSNKLKRKLFDLCENKYLKNQEDNKKNRINKYKENLGKL